MKDITYMKVALTVITITEILVTHSLGGSFILWICYGLYKSGYKN